MANFYRIQIGTIHLTKTGSAGGLPCKLEIENLEDLQVEVSGTSQIAANGSRIRQAIEWTAGKEFQIKINILTGELYETLKDFLDTANETDASFIVSGIGDSGDFVVSAKPKLDKPFSCGGFINGKIKDVVLRFET